MQPAAGSRAGSKVAAGKAIIRPHRIVKMPPMGFKNGAVVFGHGGADTALRRVGVKGYEDMVKGAVVGVDASCLLHGPLRTVDVQQVLTVDPHNSVRYLVASTLSDFMKAKLLATVRAVFLVFDPKRRNAHHCEDCKSKYTTAYAKKCSCTSRGGAQGRADKARAAYAVALAAFNNEISVDPEDAELRDNAGRRLSAAFKTLMAATDTVTQTLEDAVLHFAGEWNDKVLEARTLAAKGVAVPKKSEEQDWGARPLIHCINSPVEADDQLAYFVRVGLVQVARQPEGAGPRPQAAAGWPRAARRSGRHARHRDQRGRGCGGPLFRTSHTVATNAAAVLNGVDVHEASVVCTKNVDRARGGTGNCNNQPATSGSRCSCH